MGQAKKLLKYYRGLLMGIETFRHYQEQAESEQIKASYEEILFFYEKLLLQIANCLEQEDISIPHGLSPFQQLASISPTLKIKKTKDEKKLWQDSCKSYHFGLTMMEEFVHKYQKDLTADQHLLLIQQIQDTYQMGKSYNLIPF